jgi:hypothetical protein
MRRRLGPPWAIETTADERPPPSEVRPTKMKTSSTRRPEAAQLQCRCHEVIHRWARASEAALVVLVHGHNTANPASICGESHRHNEGETTESFGDSREPEITREVQCGRHAVRTTIVRERGRVGAIPRATIVSR